MAIKQDVNAPLILTIGIVSGLLLLVVAFGVQAWFVREEREEITQKWEVSKNTWLDDIRSNERSKIEQRGPTTIPVAQAMQYVIKNGGKLPATRPAK
jgi:hypothetical protein